MGFAVAPAFGLRLRGVFMSGHLLRHHHAVMTTHM
jgi:hypothetical protein